MESCHFKTILLMVGKVKSVKMVSEKALHFHFYPKVVNCGENVDGGWVCQDLFIL